ncbi:TPA: bifunctional hydroxymethylpyrimidine kinase/phosphomethylpyrimidine kinase, partial [Staphylococcus aureus]|nr:bifunctional hydroxymethylpyrimidine kinase/phosphomethylpyrimidine kinase [Staphylococcus aureus]
RGVHGNFFNSSISSPSHNLHAVDWLILNKDEVESFVGKDAQTEAELIQYIGEIRSLGVKNLVVTSGKDNIIYDGEEGQRQFEVKKVENVVDVTGAGDAFTSGLIYGWLKSYEIDKIIDLAKANASKTIQTAYTVRQDLDKKQLIKDMEAL